VPTPARTQLATSHRYGYLSHHRYRASSPTSSAEASHARANSHVRSLSCLESEYEAVLRLHVNGLKVVVAVGAVVAAAPHAALPESASWSRTDTGLRGRASRRVPCCHGRRGPLASPASRTGIPVAVCSWAQKQSCSSSCPSSWLVHMACPPSHHGSSLLSLDVMASSPFAAPVEWRCSSTSPRWCPHSRCPPFQVSRLSRGRPCVAWTGPPSRCWGQPGARRRGGRSCDPGGRCGP